MEYNGQNWPKTFDGVCWAEPSNDIVEMTLDASLGIKPRAMLQTLEQIGRGTGSV